MYIAATTYTIQPDRKAEMLALLRDKTAGKEAESLLMKIPGVTGYCSLAKPDADEGIIMITYETEAQAKAAPTTPEYQPYVRSAYTAKLLSYMVQGSMNRQVYEVTSQA